MAGKNLIVAIVGGLGLILFFASSSVSDPPRVSILATDTQIECHIEPSSLNRWLDLIIEDSTGEGYDLADHPRPLYSLDIPRPLSCPLSESPADERNFVRAACELQWFDLIRGKMRIDYARTNLVCEKQP